MSKEGGKIDPRDLYNTNDFSTTPNLGAVEGTSSVPGLEFVHSKKESDNKQIFDIHQEAILELARSDPKAAYRLIKRIVSSDQHVSQDIMDRLFLGLLHAKFDRTYEVYLFLKDKDVEHKWDLKILFDYLSSHPYRVVQLLSNPIADGLSEIEINKLMRTLMVYSHHNSYLEDFVTDSSYAMFKKLLPKFLEEYPDADKIIRKKLKSSKQEDKLQLLDKIGHLSLSEGAPSGSLDFASTEENADAKTEITTMPEQEYSDDDVLKPGFFGKLFKRIFKK